MNRQAEKQTEKKKKKKNETPENDKELGVDEPTRPFDIGDHVQRIMDLMNLMTGDGSPGKGICKMLGRMTAPGMLDSLPFSDVLDSDDSGGMDGLHHKVIMIIGRPNGLTIDGDDVGDVGDILRSVTDKLEAVRSISNVRMGSNDGISRDDLSKSLTKLADAFLVALRCADVTRHRQASADDAASIVRACSPIRHRRVASGMASGILSGIVADASAYTDAPAFWRSMANRIKDVYHSLIDQHSERMGRVAFVTTRNPVEDFTGRQGFNMCPKFRSHMNAKAMVPVEQSYCRDYCVEGRPEDDGDVVCKYAIWLDTIDTQEKALARFPELKNPINEHMRINLPDGQRSFPRKANAYSIEQRMQRDNLNSTKRDVVSGIERRLDDSKSSGMRDDKGHLIPLERRIDEARGDRKAPVNTFEARLDDKRESGPHGITADNTIEARLRTAYPEDEFGFDHRKLIDELLEDQFPRKESERPREGHNVV